MSDSDSSDSSISTSIEEIASITPEIIQENLDLLSEKRY